MDKRVTLVLALIAMTSQAHAVFAEDTDMELGIREYTSGKYSDAVDHLGAALKSEFNNAKLHYYMGSCYLKLKKKEAAVREFRIAFALEPTGTAGQYSKQALAGMGVDTQAAPSTTTASSSGSGANDVFTKALQDQRALGRAIAEYSQRLGGGASYPSTLTTPPGTGQVLMPPLGVPVPPQSRPQGLQNYPSAGYSNSQGGYPSGPQGGQQYFPPSRY